jgi:hypothetical protein
LRPDDRKRVRGLLSDLEAGPESALGYLNDERVLNLL